MEIRINKKPLQLSAPTRDDILNLIQEMDEYNNDDYIVAFNIAKIRAKKERTPTSYSLTQKTSYTANVYVFKTDFIIDNDIQIHQFNDYFRIIENGVINYKVPHGKTYVINQRLKCTVSNKIVGEKYYTTVGLIDNIDTSEMKTDIIVMKCEDKNKEFKKC